VANKPPSLRQLLDDRWTVHTSISVEDAGIDELWPLFADALAHIKLASPVRQVLSRDEFEATCRNVRVLKTVVRDGKNADAAVGLSIATNDLEAAPEPSPDYFARRWPKHHAAGRIWYISYVIVAPAYSATSVVAVLMRQVLDLVDDQGGVVALDFSEVNDAAHNLSRSIPRLSRFLGRPAKPLRLDAQVFWAYELSAGDAADLAK
jgi:hypothetical protein